jgi:hypothetical protein
VARPQRADGSHNLGDCGVDYFRDISGDPGHHIFQVGLRTYSVLRVISVESELWNINGHISRSKNMRTC